ncbi:3-dehydrosphinganine reductase [Coemansia sp. RSA 1822]|nr:3-dehydrosphinganine reductase [Coemansia sp. RSA 1822]
MMDDWRVGLVTMGLVTVGFVLCGILALGLVNEAYVRITARKFDVRGKHCYVTGGSQGLGKSLACELARRGAHVTIVARREAVLKAALAEISACASKDQEIEYVVADIASEQGAVDAVDEAEKRNGRAIENVFTVAGTANPGVFIDQPASLLRSTMDINYFGTLYTVHAAAKRMVERKIEGQVVMVSSILGMLGLVGYAAYSPSKFAVRGLAEALRTELQAHNISVHCYFPGTIFTPGYEQENLTKPQVTKEIEGADDGQTPEQCVRGMIKGLERGEFAIATDPIGMLFRCATRGVMPNNNFVLDSCVAWVAWIAFVPWRMVVDHTVIKYARKQKTD